MHKNLFKGHKDLRIKRLKGSALVFFAFLGFNLFHPRGAFAYDVLINELSTQSSPIWIEIYVFGDTDVSGWYIKNTTSNVYTFPSMPPIGSSSNKFLAIDVGTGLNKYGDHIYLYDNQNNLVDDIPYGEEGGVCLPTETETIGRFENGNTIERFSTPTKGSSNEGATLDPCPAPTSASTGFPTARLVLTHTPTPTNTPTPKSTATPTKKKPTPTPISGLTQSNRSNDEEDKSTLGTSTQTEETNDAGGTKRNIPIAAFVVGFVGLAFIGTSAFLFFKKRK